MNRVDKELDEFGKRTFAPLQEAPPPDPHLLAQEKAKFLALGVSLQQSLIPRPAEPDRHSRQQRSDSASRKHPGLFLKAFTAALIALFILVSSSLTVFAAQSSLPGDTLYPVKSWSEDIRLSITHSPQSRLHLTLDYAERRIFEITSLVSEGRSLPDSTSERFQVELERALELAAEMDDEQMHLALGQIKKQAESQDMTLEELLNTLPDQAKPALLRLKLRLQEQVSLSSIGETDPQAFRSEIHKRQQNKPESHKKDPENVDSEVSPEINPTDGQPTQEEPGNGKGDQPDTPGNNGNGEGNGQGKPNPGNGNNGPGPSETIEP